MFQDRNLSFKKNTMRNMKTEEDAVVCCSFSIVYFPSCCQSSNFVLKMYQEWTSTTMSLQHSEATKNVKKVRLKQIIRGGLTQAVPLQFANQGLFPRVLQPPCHQKPEPPPPKRQRGKETNRSRPPQIKHKQLKHVVMFRSAPPPNKSKKTLCCDVSHQPDVPCLEGDAPRSRRDWRTCWFSGNHEINHQCGNP